MEADDDGAEAEAMGGQGVEMIAQWAELMDLRPSQAATAPVMIAAKLTPEALAQAKAFLKDANLQEDMELHGMVSLYEKTYNGLACKVAEVDCKKGAREAGRASGGGKGADGHFPGKYGPPQGGARSSG